MTMMKAAVALVALSGCATLFGGGPDSVTITSRPPGATIKVNGNVVGQTPMMLAFDRDSPANIQLELDGYRPESFQLEKSFNSWTILNLTDFIGWIIDFADGNWESYNDGVDMGLHAIGSS
jgi:hypothetical protein